MLGEVCCEYKGRAESTEDLPVVGLEHLSQSDVDLLGCSHEETTFTKGFRKGHVLFGRRRAYLKKASLAPFAGVCSGDIIVIEAIEDKLCPDLLPFVIQNDCLFDFAVENSAGSLSPRVKWKDLSRFEFDLPSMGKQQELAKLLWSAQEVKRVYSRLISACEEIVKSRFIEMFGDVRLNTFGWPIKTFEELAEIITDGEHATPERQEDGIYLLSARNVKDHELDLSDVDFIGEDEYQRIARRIVPQADDVLISCSGTIGRCCVVPPGLRFQMVRSAALIRFTDLINPIYAEWLIASDDVQEQIRKSATQSSQANLFQGRIKKLKGIVPPLALQQEFAFFVQQVDKSEFALKQAIEGVNATMAAILNKELGMSDVQ